MINIRSEQEIEKMRIACRLAADTMAKTRDAIRPGITTAEVAKVAQDYIEEHGGKAAFLGYHGYPGAICVSVNEEVVHGIPGARVLRDGDIVKLDIGTYVGGFYGDMCRTYPVGDISEEAKRLIEITRQSLNEGMKQAVSGNRVGHISNAVQTFVEKNGFSVVRALVGHGIGRNLHEEPQVPNFGAAGSGQEIKSGMILAIEPMVNVGTWKVDTLSDDWTVVTTDGRLSAHFENTCAVGDGVPEILTIMDGESEWRKTIQ